MKGATDIMSKAKYQYIMDYIDDKAVYAAVIFACKMLREGTSYWQAIRTASRYYDVDMDEVAHFVAQRGSRRQKERG